MASNECAHSVAHNSFSLTEVPDSEDEELDLTAVELACWDEAQRGMCRQVAASSHTSGVVKSTTSPPKPPADAASQAGENHAFLLPDHQAFLRMPAGKEKVRRNEGKESAKLRDYDTVFTNAKVNMTYLYMRMTYLYMNMTYL